MYMNSKWTGREGMPDKALVQSILKKPRDQRTEKEQEIVESVVKYSYPS